jgi:ribosomal protein S3AE
VGKNNKLGNKRKGGRTAVAPFNKKEWYNIQAHNMVVDRQV